MTENHEDQTELEVPQRPAGRRLPADYRSGKHGVSVGRRHPPSLRARLPGNFSRGHRTSARRAAAAPPHTAFRTSKKGSESSLAPGSYPPNATTILF